MCTPCASSMDALLPIEDVRAQVADMPLWSLEDMDDGRTPSYRISRLFTAKDFQAGLNALNAVGAVAEREGHHPDLQLTNYREVKISLWTHKLRGLTQTDFNLAKIIDEEVTFSYSPKWLREHPAAKDQLIGNLGSSQM